MAQYTIKIVNNSTTDPTYVVFQTPPEVAANSETLQTSQSARPALATVDFAARPETTATVTHGPDGAWTVSYS